MKKICTISVTVLFLFIFSGLVNAQDKVVVVPLGSGSGGGAEVTTVFFSGTNNSSTDKRYAGIAGSSSGSSINGKVFPMTRNGTIKNFTLYINSNVLTVNCTITLEKNGAATLITATYDSTTQTGVITIPGTVDYAAGDTFDIYAQVSGATSSGQIQFAGSFDIEY